MNRRTNFITICYLVPSVVVVVLVQINGARSAGELASIRVSSCFETELFVVVTQERLCDLVSNPPAQLVPPSTLPPNLVACMEEEEGAQAVEARKNGKMEKYKNT